MTEIKNINDLLGKSLTGFKKSSRFRKGILEQALKDAIKEASQVEQEAQKAIESFSRES